jgi:hypothetical protein
MSNAYIVCILLSACIRNGALSIDEADEGCSNEGEVIIRDSEELHGGMV